MRCLDGNSSRVESGRRSRLGRGGYSRRFGCWIVSTQYQVLERLLGIVGNGDGRKAGYVLIIMGKREKGTKYPGVPGGYGDIKAATVKGLTGVGL
jgi:hypothetical protein